MYQKTQRLYDQDALAALPDLALFLMRRVQGEFHRTLSRLLDSFITKEL
ncbi:MAG TPA: hypothetical protein PLP17_01050 [Oligoflexia bacterium]|nr:hypothetical protein [Oligoflexia bacterium]